MKLAIMQPYFLPYIGYFQLIGAVDMFVVYDNIKYTKKGWINRNRLLQNGTDAVFSLPLAKDADNLDVVQRELAESFDRDKLLNQFRGAYERAPHFSAVWPLLVRIVRCEERNLFRYVHHSITHMCELLQLKTDLRVSSSISIDHDLKAQDKVIALCHAVGADCYVNSIGGVEIYDREAFKTAGIKLQFLRPQSIGYSQFKTSFVPWLSTIDVMMFNPPERVSEVLGKCYDFV